MPISLGLLWMTSVLQKFFGLPPIFIAGSSKNLILLTNTVQAVFINCDRRREKKQNILLSRRKKPRLDLNCQRPGANNQTGNNTEQPMGLKNTILSRVKPCHHPTHNYWQNRFCSCYYPARFNQHRRPFRTQFADQARKCPHEFPWEGFSFCRWKIRYPKR